MQTGIIFKIKRDIRMVELHQVIIQNTPEKGLDIVASTLEKSQICDIFQFLPTEIPSEFNKVYLTKFQSLPSKITLLFTFDDGIDQFGRKSIKTHTLVVDEAFYNKKTIQFFISPLINGIMNVEENNLLKPEDFRELAPYPVSSKIIELSYSKKHFHISSKLGIDEITLIQLFASLDRAIPPQLNSFFSFQTFVSPSKDKIIKNRSITYSPKILPNSYLLESLNSERSDCHTIQTITDSLDNLPLLRRLQNQLFLGLPEKRFNLKFHWRFGIKTLSQIRKALFLEHVPQSLNIHDEVRILRGPFKGVRTVILNINHDRGEAMIELSSVDGITIFTIPISDVELIPPENAGEENM